MNEQVENPTNSQIQISEEEYKYAQEVIRKLSDLSDCSLASVLIMSALGDLIVSICHRSNLGKVCDANDLVSSCKESQLL